MKLRNDYEKTLWRRLVRFVDGITLQEIEEHAEELREELAEQQEESDQKAEAAFEAVPEPESREERRRQAEEAHAKEASAMLEKYKNWPKEHGIKIFGRLYALMSVVLCAIIIITLLATVSYLPEFGHETNPNNNEVVERYNADGLAETGATNAVAGMILDYRAFDTLGESHVLFIAAVCVMILLRLEYTKDGKPTDVLRSSEENDRLYEPKNDKILQRIVSAGIQNGKGSGSGHYFIWNICDSERSFISGGWLFRWCHHRCRSDSVRQCVRF